MNKFPTTLPEWIATMLSGEFAHASLENAVKNIPFDYLGVVPRGLEYSIWQLTEHIRIAQWDILEFSKNRKHKSPKWPDEYWPLETKPKDGEWEECLEKIKQDKMQLISLIMNPSNNLLSPFPDGEGQNLLREVLLVLDHNAYHTGQIVLIRKLLGIWTIH